jgi:hypothetical protein
MKAVSKDEALKLIADGRHIFLRHPWYETLHEMKDSEHCKQHKGDFLLMEEDDLYNLYRNELREKENALARIREMREKLRVI